MLACSTAAGPAFEGAEITFGMRATDGAIEKVWIEDDVKVQTI
ncbi:MAG: ATP-binding protein, partial [Chloroflexi bacterium]|nr:ATP-binding protein [Chloroflexota bacterium]